MQDFARCEVSDAGLPQALVTRIPFKQFGAVLTRPARSVLPDPPACLPFLTTTSSQVGPYSRWTLMSATTT